MKRTQNEKILQIKNETLVVGIDIAKKIHFARAFDNRGIELGKLLRFENSAQGFEAFDAWVQGIKQKNGMTEALVGFEPTGHYWFNLGDHLVACGYKLAIVNPFHVKCARELDDNSPSKSDRKDPKTIAMLVKDGRYRDVYIPEGVYQELRELVCERERHQERLSSLKNQIVRWLDIYFPEFTTVFKDWSKQAAWLTRLCLVASESIGRTEGTRASASNLQFLMTEYELISMRLDSLKEQMEEYLAQIPNANYLLAIKGMGVVAAAIIVSELGNISRFTDPRQLIKYAGLNLRENSSGMHKDKTTISKRGRRRLRHGLFQAMIPILATNSEFRVLHKRNITRTQNPLTKMQSLIALCGKLLRITFALLTKGIAYDPIKLAVELPEMAQAA